jgi:hypothetical protein
MACPRCANISKELRSAHRRTIPADRVIVLQQYRVERGGIQCSGLSHDGWLDYHGQTPIILNMKKCVWVRPKLVAQN